MQWIIHLKILRSIHFSHGIYGSPNGEIIVIEDNICSI